MFWKFLWMIITLNLDFVLNKLDFTFNIAYFNKIQAAWLRLILLKAKILIVYNVILPFLKYKLNYNLHCEKSKHAILCINRL